MKISLSNREKAMLLLLAITALACAYSKLFWIPIHQRTQFFTEQIRAGKNTLELSKSGKSTFDQSKTIGNQVQKQNSGTARHQTDAATDVATTTMNTTTSMAAISTVTTAAATVKTNLSLQDMEKNSEIAYNMMITSRNASLHMQNLEFGERTILKSSPPISFVPVSAKLSGTSEAVMKFVKLLEKNCTMTEIQRMDVKSAAADTACLDVNIRYYFIGVD